jgi:hypothetical protein
MNQMHPSSSTPVEFGQKQGTKMDFRSLREQCIGDLNTASLFVLQEQISLANQDTEGMSEAEKIDRLVRLDIARRAICMAQSRSLEPHVLNFVDRNAQNPR